MGLSDLRSFDLSLSKSDSKGAKLDSLHIGLGDISYFQAEAEDGVFTRFSLVTNTIVSSNGIPYYFTASGLGDHQAQLFAVGSTTPHYNGQLKAQITPDPHQVPEPATLALTLAALALAGVLRPARSVAAPSL